MKRLKGIIIAVIISLASILMPFNIYADTITTANIVGVSAVVSDSLVNGQVTFNSQTFNTYYVNYDVEIIFDQAYLGYVQLTLEYDYYNRDSSGIVDRTNNQTRRVFVNGTSAHINLNILSAYSNAPLQVTYNNPRVSTITTGGTNVTPIGDLTDLQQIVEILQDIYSLESDIEGLENNQLLQLQQVVANTSLANQYLEKLTELRQWNIPFESYSFVLFMLYQNYDISDFYEYNYLRFPMFYIPNGSQLMRFYANTDSEFVFIFLVNGNISNTSQLQSAFSIDDGSLIYSNRLNRIILGNTSYSLLKIYARNFTSNGNKTITVVGNKNLVPIYYASSLYAENISTEFALQFNLTNRLLNNLDIIANGTTQSNSAASDLESGNSQMADDMDDLATIENGYNQQFNNQLQQIDFSSPLQSNSGILPAANFVINIFNGLINNNPFSVLIIIVCILLIGKKVIGK